MVTIERFAALLDAYGADPRRWPDGERASAHALAATDPRARALLAEAKSLDGVMALSPAPRATETLRQHVLERAPTRSQAGRWAVSAWARMWAPSAGLAAAAVAGVMFGAALGTQETDSAALAVLAESEPFDEQVLLGGEVS